MESMSASQFAAWYEHPVTRVARAELDEPPSAGDLLGTMYDLLVELDERFPGLPMREVLASGGAAPTLGELREGLESAGVPAAKATEALRGRPPKYPALRRALADEVRAGTSVRAVARKYGVSPGTVHRSVLAVPA